MGLMKKLISGRMCLTALTFIVSAFSVALTLWWNRLVSQIIDVMGKGLSIPLNLLSMAAAAVVVCSLSAYIMNLLSAWTVETLAHDLRMGYTRHIASLSFAEIENMNVGEQLSRLQNEINDVSAYLRTQLTPIVEDVIKFIATFSFMLWLNPKLTIIANAPSFLILAYTVLSSRVIGHAAMETQKANASMNGFADTLTTLFPVMKLFEATSLVGQGYNAALEVWEGAAVREERRRSLLMSLSGLMSVIPLLLLFLEGGRQVMDGVTAIGTLYIFINLSGNVSGVLMNLPGRIAMYRRFSANASLLEGFVRVKKRRAP